MPGDAALRVLVNPQGLDAEIGADFLARCFGTPWTEAMHRWYHQRPFGGEPPDRVIVVDGERVVAACWLVYRVLRTPDGVTHRVAVIVSGTTVPGERGHGVYAQMLQGVISLGAQRHCTALLGFVLADNASGRGLQRLGATEIASAYIASRGPIREVTSGTLRVRDAAVSDAWRSRAVAHQHAPPPRVVFHYPDAGTWASQMVHRVHPVEPLRIGSTSRALVECIGDTDQLQWLDGDPRERVAAIRALAAHAQRRGRRFLVYSTRADDVEAVRRIGMVTRPGYLLALAPEPRHVPTVRGWAALSWDVQSGDRM